MRLVETDQSISLVTSAAGLIDVVAMVTTSSAISGDVTASDGGSEYAEISSAGTTTIVAAPASASLRKQPTDITIRNAHTSVTNTVTILFNDTSASLNLEVAKATLAPGEALTYTQGGGWVKLDANGGRITSQGATSAPSDIQIFNGVGGTWTKPTTFTPKMVIVEIIGAGGGGGAGASLARDTWYSSI